MSKKNSVLCLFEPGICWISRYFYSTNTSWVEHEKLYDLGPVLSYCPQSKKLIILFRVSLLSRDDILTPGLTFLWSVSRLFNRNLSGTLFTNGYQKWDDLWGMTFHLLLSEPKQTYEMTTERLETSCRKVSDPSQREKPRSCVVALEARATWRALLWWRKEWEEL